MYRCLYSYLASYIYIQIHKAFITILCSILNFHQKCLPTEFGVTQTSGFTCGTTDGVETSGGEKSLNAPVGLAAKANQKLPLTC